MRLTRRSFTTGALGAAAFATLPTVRARAAGGVHRSHGASLIGDLRYGPDFAHFEHVNPDAPKGGVARLSTQSSFDSFNPFIVKGDSPTGIGLIFDALMTPSLEEGSTEYGLIAEWIEHPDDFSWVAFKIRDEARFHDGTPITPADAIFSLDILKEKGQPFYRLYYADVAGARDMGGNVVRFDFNVANNRELPHIMGQLNILPKHWWEGRAFDESSLEPIMGSGPYRIGDFEAGRYIAYDRVKDYWAADLPVNRGMHNFDQVRYEVFLDSQAAFEGFKAGAYDYVEENSSKQWATGYDFPAVERGDVKRLEFNEEGPKRSQIFAFNLRREKFQDRRVREAIGLAFDFEATNKTVYFGQYARPTSFFQGTHDLMQAGPPDAAELALLEPLRGQVPDEVFGDAFAPPKTNADGRNRRNLRRAAKLLAEAGLTIDGGKLLRPNGERFEIEFLTASSTQERVLSPFIQNLEKLGFTARMVLVDGPQYIRRVAQDDTFPWDMIIWGVSNSESPGNEQREFWGSDAAMRVGARNVAGVADPAVDALIEKIIFAENREQLAAASRALDRVLLWNHYAIMQLYTPFERYAWWDKFGHPDPLPPRGAAFPTVWWWDEDKARKIK